MSNVYEHFGLSAAVSGSSRDAIRFAGDSIQVYFNEAVSGIVTTSAVFRDASAWYHIVVSIDTTKATAADRIIIYVNGVLQTVTGTQPSQNYNFTGFLVSGKEQNIGRNPQPAYYADSYLADVFLIDSQALTPTSFGEYDTNNVWQPKAFSGGSYGTNGFHLPFSDNSTAAALGTDTSSNGNTWTVNNISVTAGAGNDSLVDSPTNGSQTDTGVGGEVVGNYCTWNPLKVTSLVGAGITKIIGNGNLDTRLSNVLCLGTIGVLSGKWYWEVTAASFVDIIGVAKDSINVDGAYPRYIGQDSTSWGYYGGNGQLQTNASASAYGAVFTSGDVIGVALDCDNGKLFFSKNGTWQNSGNPATGSNPASSSLTSGPYFPGISDAGAGGSGLTASTNFGQRPFAYTAPSGFKALCTTNLPEPTIADGSTVMDVALYTGNGSTQTISGLNFSPDLIWIKNRNSTYHHALYDTIRGSTKMLSSSETAAEITYSSVTSQSAGFDLSGAESRVNENALTYAAWTWDAGSSTVTNTEGSITSSVRANASAGFSIVTYTGTGSNGTVGHGLGVAPGLIFVKARSFSAWPTYHVSTGKDYPLQLNNTNAAINLTNYWGSTSPSSTVFGTLPGYDNNINGATTVAYCFAPVAGYSSFGSYTGNGSADGPFVYTGMRPRWIVFKRTSTTSNWSIFDTSRGTYNSNTPELTANTSNAEAAVSGRVDILSNGFKLRANTFPNDSATTFIYAAFAESPFKYARAR